MNDTTPRTWSVAAFNLDDDRQTWESELGEIGLVTASRLAGTDLHGTWDSAWPIDLATLRTLGPDVVLQPESETYFLCYWDASRARSR